jgi:Ca2+-binding RTX toxin-like protein
VTIDVGVKILGAQAGTSATGRDAASAAGASNILGSIVVSSQSNVTIDGVRIVNDTLGSPPSLDILASAGNIVLTNSVIFSTVAGASTGDFAIAVRPSAGGTVTVTNNQISGTSTNQFGSANFQSGLFFDGGGRVLTFTGNLVDKGRTGINLDAAGTSTANVSDNDFRSVGSAITVGVNANLAGLTIANNDVQNVGSEFSFRNLTRGVTFDAGAALDVLTPAGNPNDLIAVLGGSGGDNFTGSEFADLLDGNFNSATATDADVLKGLAGDDQLFGRGGDDSLTGGTGNDTLDGGAKHRHRILQRRPHRLFRGS